MVSHLEFLIANHAARRILGAHGGQHYLRLVYDHLHAHSVQVSRRTPGCAAYN